MKRCITCGRNTKEFAEFPCSSCGNKLVRCYTCRQNKIDYSCSCGFMGP